MYQNMETINRIYHGLGGGKLIDVGGGVNPIVGADVIVDHAWGPDPNIYGNSERVTLELDENQLPFPDNHFSFSVCSHTLEDCKNAPFVGSEVFRVSRAGYIEIPHRLEELSNGVGGKDRGWEHHHWVCDTSPTGLLVCRKSDVLPRYVYDGPHPRFIAIFWAKQDVDVLVKEVQVDPLIWNRREFLGDVISTDTFCGKVDGEYIFTTTIKSIL